VFERAGGQAEVAEPEAGLTNLQGNIPLAEEGKVAGHAVLKKEPKDTAEHSRRHTQTVIEALRVQVEEKDRLRSDAAASLESCERQRAELVAECRALREILVGIGQTRAYRLLRRLGRWRWVDEMLARHGEVP